MFYPQSKIDELQKQVTAAELSAAIARSELADFKKAQDAKESAFMCIDARYLSTEQLIERLVIAEAKADAYRTQIDRLEKQNVFRQKLGEVQQFLNANGYGIHKRDEDGGNPKIVEHILI